MTTSFTCDITEIVLGDTTGRVGRVEVYVTFPNTLGGGPSILSFNTVVELEEPESGEYIPFDNLTLDQIKQWAVTNGNISEMVDDHIDRVRIILGSTSS